MHLNETFMKAWPAASTRSNRQVYLPVQLMTVHFGSDGWIPTLLFGILFLVCGSLKTANPSKITFDDETIFGVTKVTLSTISYNVYDTEKDCVTAEGNFQKDEYESNEILDNSYFTRKTRSMAMLEGLVLTLMSRPYIWT